MKRKIYGLLLLLAVCCSRESVEFPEMSEPALEVDLYQPGRQASFGEQTGHPFSMENVLKAYGNLPVETRAAFSADQIAPTHKYVRFVPTCDDEADAVLRHTELDIYQYPLDCEITEGFIGINNPFEINGYPQYWTVVPADCPLNSFDCPYEVESELWMPKYLEEVPVRSTEWRFESKLLDELCREQGISNPVSPDTKGSSKYYPEGYVKYSDTELGIVGIEGMVVEAYTFWHNYKATSTNTGYLNYGSASFKGDFKYRIKFSRDDFAIRVGNEKSDLEYVTSNTYGALNRTFTGEYAKYSVIFQAAQRYYYQANEGIPRPPMNGTWKACLRFHVYNYTDEQGRGIGLFSFDDRDLLVNRPVVLIWEYNGTEELSSDELYGTAIHELTHAMHFNMDPDLYISIEKRVGESLARGVELYWTMQRYPDYTLDGNYSIDFYTAIMRDLTDGKKMVQCNWVGEDGDPYAENTSKAYSDKIDSAYTIPEMVEAVKTCKTPQDWYTMIQTLYPNRIPLDLYLVEAFRFWFSGFEEYYVN